MKGKFSLSTEQALAHQFRPDHWLRMVGEKRRDGDKEVIFSLHPITLEGRLACKCNINERGYYIYSMNGVSPSCRHLVCDEGADYIRTVVIQEQGEVQ